MQSKFFVFFMLSLPLTAQAQTKPRCDGERLSTADEGFCLATEYDQASKLLSGKIRQLLELAASADTGFSDPKYVKERRAAFVQAIRESQNSWRRLVEAECSVLVVGSFGIGNGGENAAVQCKIDRTYERIGHLSKTEAYRWLWP
ncbi:DUF1311 domain-containing protein [Aquincola sp. S2]|uniref:DUF1311 domain-containing protein n=1 Tax=Pseudaquabacterium terrae TaxID=2732868 RepID=A0ABX2EUU4_9BURK|nr:lysozyme inhibitor LprI family protein [Aquabacterium terrae]NRF72417.1 DUF1311 domain-containing protein [Aquabacterium terrae]